jgi:hypothetical protein
MFSNSPFDPEAAARRREKEPTWRRFPSLWETFPAQKAGFLDGLVQVHTGQSRPVTTGITSAAMAKFFAERAPHSLYPYVWVRNALNPVPDACGMHGWLHEILVSYEASDMPPDAPIRFANGVLETLDMKTLKFGSTSRFCGGSRDLVMQHCAYAHLGPAQRLHADGAQDEDKHDEEAVSAPAP